MQTDMMVSDTLKNKNKKKLNSDLKMEPIVDRTVKTPLMTQVTPEGNAQSCGWESNTIST